MHAQDLPTVPAGPPFNLLFQIPLQAEVPDGLEVFDHTYKIACSITPIQVLQCLARIIPTFKTVLDLTGHYPPAGFDPADNPGLRLKGIVTATPGAWVPFPIIGPAQAAVQSARRNEINSERFRSGSHGLSCVTP